jgi:signal transduction histidine kinase
MLLDDEADDPVTRREYLQIILDEGERLTNLINDILDLSKMEAGRRIFRFAPGHPLAVVRKVVTVVEPDARKKGLSLTASLPSEDREALIDADLLHQAVMNLAANAVKYTPAGGHLRLGLAWGETTYRIEVKDDGPGIAEEDQKRLFTKFFRVENSLNRDIGGTGLGLALVRQIAQVHQGQVGLQSTPGQGSLFHLDLPYSFEPSPRAV